MPRSIFAGRASTLLAACGALLSSAWFAHAEHPPGIGGDEPSAAQVTEAPVVIWNRQVTVFRSTFLGVPPADRAARTARNIDELLERGGPGTVTVGVESEGRSIAIDGASAVFLTPDDVDHVREETLDQAVAETVAALTKVIAETREARDSELLVSAGASSALVSIVFVALLFVLSRIRRVLARRLSAVAGQATTGLAGKGAAFISRERINRAILFVLRAVTWVLSLLFTYWWLSYVLRRFPYTRPWGERLAEFLVDAASRIGNAVLVAIPNLAVAVLVFLAARGLAGLLGSFFSRVESGLVEVPWLDRDMARPTRRLATVLVWIFALVMGLPYLPGADSEAFKGVSVLVGLMVTVGASGMVSHGASGLILLYTRAMRVGEYVRIGDNEGTVTEMGAFTTRLRTGLGEEIVLPNALVFGTVTRNYSRHVKGQGYIVDTLVTIGYDTPWRQVEAMLIEAAQRTTGIADSPPPRVFQARLSDFYPEYRLVCHALPEQPGPRAVVLTALHANIQDVFNEYGVQIMSPNYEADPAEPKVVPPANRYAAPAQPPA